MKIPGIMRTPTYSLGTPSMRRKMLSTYSKPVFSPRSESALKSGEAVLTKTEKKKCRLLRRGHGVDALDYFGLWKLFDGLSVAVFYCKNRECALGNTNQQRYMRKFSDGTPVKKLVVTDMA